MVFASGSPFTPLQREDAATGRRVTMHPAQANNAYVFPSVGYAAVLTQGATITDEVKFPTHSPRAGLPPSILFQELYDPKVGLRTLRVCCQYSRDRDVRRVEFERSLFC